MKDCNGVDIALITDCPITLIQMTVINLGRPEEESHQRRILLPHHESAEGWRQAKNGHECRGRQTGNQHNLDIMMFEQSTVSSSLVHIPIEFFGCPLWTFSCIYSDLVSSESRSKFIFADKSSLNAFISILIERSHPSVAAMM